MEIVSPILRQGPEFEKFRGGWFVIDFMVALKVFSKVPKGLSVRVLGLGFCYQSFSPYGQKDAARLENYVSF